jgi:hypothetical protein
MSDYQAVRSKEVVTSATRALSALRSWVLTKSRRPNRADLQELERALRFGPKRYVSSLHAVDAENHIPPSSQVFDAFWEAVRWAESQESKEQIRTAWSKLVEELPHSFEPNKHTALSAEQALFVLEFIERWLAVLLRKPAIPEHRMFLKVKA